MVRKQRRSKPQLVGLYARRRPPEPCRGGSILNIGSSNKPGFPGAGSRKVLLKLFLTATLLLWSAVSTATSLPPLTLNFEGECGRVPYPVHPSFSGCRH